MEERSSGRRGRWNVTPPDPATISFRPLTPAAGEGATILAAKPSSEGSAAAHAPSTRPARPPPTSRGCPVAHARSTRHATADSEHSADARTHTRARARDPEHPARNIASRSTRPRDAVRSRRPALRSASPHLAARQAATAPPGAYIPSGHSTRSPVFAITRTASYAATLSRLASRYASTLSGLPNAYGRRERFGFFGR